MILELGEGSIQIDVPEKFKRLVPANYKLEARRINKEGQEPMDALAIIKITTVATPITEAELNMDDERFKELVLAPMLEALEKTAARKHLASLAA